MALDSMHMERLLWVLPTPLFPNMKKKKKRRSPDLIPRQYIRPFNQAKETKIITMTKKKSTAQSKNQKKLNDDIPAIRVKFHDPKKEKQLQQQQELEKKAKAMQTPSDTILVSNVPPSYMDKFDFKMLFETFGDVLQWNTFANKEQGNCGMVKFATVQQAINAMKALNDKMIDKSMNKPLVLAYEQKKQPQPKKIPEMAKANSSSKVTTAHVTFNQKEAKVNRSMLQQLEQMGFSEAKSVEALIAVSNSSVDDAVNYICTNMLDSSPSEPTATVEKDKETKKKRKAQKSKSKEQSIEQPQEQLISDALQHEIHEKSNQLIEQETPQELNANELKTKATQLINMMKSLISNDEYLKFRKLSADFQKGTVKASEYYKQFHKLFANNEEELFFLLIETMPSSAQNKIEELLQARHKYHNKEMENSKIHNSKSDESHKSSPASQKQWQKDEQAKQKKKEKKKNEAISKAQKDLKPANPFSDKQNPFTLLEDSSTS
jgi:hypothetical protein